VEKYSSDRVFRGQTADNGKALLQSGTECGLTHQANYGLVGIINNHMNIGGVLTCLPSNLEYPQQSHGSEDTKSE